MPPQQFADTPDSPQRDIFHVEGTFDRCEVICHTCQKTLFSCIEGAQGFTHEDIRGGVDTTLESHLTAYDGHECSIKILPWQSFDLLIPASMLPPGFLTR